MLLLVHSLLLVCFVIVLIDDADDSDDTMADLCDWCGTDVGGGRMRFRNFARYRGGTYEMCDACYDATAFMFPP